MIIEFSVENYRSIRERQTLSLVASKHREVARPDPVVHDVLPGLSLVKSAVMYGPNAGGKSNILWALSKMREIALRSPGETIEDVQPFRLDPETAGQPSTFELTFVREGVRYQYGFSLDNERIHEEWLIAYPKRSPQQWFSRKYDGQVYEMFFGPHLKGEKLRIEKMTRPDSLFLSVAAQLNHEQLGSIAQWFRDYLWVEQARVVSQFIHSSSVAIILGDANKKVARRALIALLKVADLGTKSLRVIRREVNLAEVKNSVPTLLFINGGKLPSGKHDVFEIRVVHRDVEGAEVEFGLEEESQGTRQFLFLAARVLSVLETGATLAVDELDDSLHPMLVRKLVEIFHDPKTNPKGAQLIFNTHDTTLLDPTLYRRDQIWFVEKDEHQASKLYSLLDYKPRKGESLQRGYLAGRYGAIPFLGDFHFEAPAS